MWRWKRRDFLATVDVRGEQGAPLEDQSSRLALENGQFGFIKRAVNLTISGLNLRTSRSRFTWGSYRKIQVATGHVTGFSGTINDEVRHKCGKSKEEVREIERGKEIIYFCK